MPESLQALPGWLLVAIFVLGAVQIVLEVTALVLLVRTPRERLRLISNPWGWAAVILLVNMIGAILFLVAGRAPKAPEPTAARVGGKSGEDAIDLLYGRGDGS